MKQDEIKDFLWAGVCELECEPVRFLVREKESRLPTPESGVSSSLDVSQTDGLQTRVLDSTSVRAASEVRHWAISSGTHARAI